MAFIYAIRNKINGKMYIGKTEYTNPIRRFKIHIAERKKSRCKGRALYRALNQYGVENFEILIEHDIPIRRIHSNKPVVQIDPKTNAVIQIFESASAAERIIPTGKHINQACKGSYKTAGGYKWEYYEPHKHIIHTPGA